MNCIYTHLPSESAISREKKAAIKECVNCDCSIHMMFVHNFVGIGARRKEAAFDSSCTRTHTSGDFLARIVHKLYNYDDKFHHHFLIRYTIYNVGPNSYHNMFIYLVGLCMIFFDCCSSLISVSY